MKIDHDGKASSISTILSRSLFFLGVFVCLQTAWSADEYTVKLTYTEKHGHAYFDMRKLTNDDLATILFAINGNDKILRSSFELGSFGVPRSRNNVNESEVKRKINERMNKIKSAAKTHFSGKDHSDYVFTVSGYHVALSKYDFEQKLFMFCGPGLVSVDGFNALNAFPLQIDYRDEIQINRSCPRSPDSAIKNKSTPGNRILGIGGSTGSALLISVKDDTQGEHLYDLAQNGLLVDHECSWPKPNLGHGYQQGFDCYTYRIRLYTPQQKDLLTIVWNKDKFDYKYFF